MNFFRAFRAVARLQTLVNQGAGILLPYNTQVVAAGLPNLILHDPASGWTLNSQYRLEGWGLVFPTHVQVWAKHLPTGRSERLLVPIADLF